MSGYRIGIVLILAIFIFNCTSNEPTSPDTNQDLFDNVINENAIILDPSKTQIVESSVDTVSYVRPIYQLEVIGERPDLQEGSVIVDTTGGMPRIYVVTGKGIEKSTGLLEVVQGSLDFLIKNTELSFTTPANQAKSGNGAVSTGLPAADNEIYGKLNDNAFHIPSHLDELTYVRDFSNTPIFNSSDGRFSLTIENGTISCKPTIDFRAIYSNRDLFLSKLTNSINIGSLEYLQTVVYSDIEFNLLAHFNAKDNMASVNETIEIVSFMYPIVVGPVIVNAAISLKAQLNINAETTMDVTTAYNTTISAVVGAECSNGHIGSVEFYHEFEKKSEEIVPPEFDANAHFYERFELIPDVELYLYGFLGLNGEVIPYQEFEMNAHAAQGLIDWDCEYAAGVDGLVSLDVSAFHFDEATYSLFSKPFKGERTILYSAPTIEHLSGNNQSGVVGQTLSEPLRVKSTDNLGNDVVLPVNVYWNVSSGEGQLSDGNSWYHKPPGFAENHFTPGGSYGQYKVTASLKKADGTVHNETDFSVNALVQNYLNINSTVVELESAKNSQNTFSIASNTDWNIEEDANWLFVSSTTGIGNRTVTVAAITANESANSRSAILTVSGSDVNPQTVLVTQIAGTTVNPTVSLSDNTIEWGQTVQEMGDGFTPNGSVVMYFESPGGTIAQVTITADGDGSYHLNYTMPSGSETGTWQYWAKDLATGSESPRIPYEVISAGAYLNVDVNRVRLEYAANSQNTFAVNSNTNWQISEHADWLAVTPASGTGDCVITATAIRANETGDSRSAVVTIDGVGVEEKIVTVTQRAQNETVNHELTIIVSPAGRGRVNREPNKNQYEHNEAVSLSAVPETGWRFDHWGTDLFSSKNPDTITMDDDKIVKAYFTQLSQNEFILNVYWEADEGFDVKAGQELHFNGYGESNLGHELEWKFDWGDGSQSEYGASNQKHTYWNDGAKDVKVRCRCKVHKSVESDWSESQSIYVSYCNFFFFIAQPSEGGTVSKSPDKANYFYNEAVELTAIANSGYDFSYWGFEFEQITSNPYTLNITDNNLEVTGHFQFRQHTVSKPNPPGGILKGPILAFFGPVIGGSVCSHGHKVEYNIEWGDGYESGFGDGTEPDNLGIRTIHEHEYTHPGIYQVRTQARCAVNHEILSEWSDYVQITVTDPNP